MASTWVAASEANVMTIRELWQSLKDEGFSVDVSNSSHLALTLTPCCLG